MHIMAYIKPRHPCTMLMWHVRACTYLRYMPAIHECMHHTQCCTDAHCLVNCKLWMTYSAYYGIMQCTPPTRHAHVACACMYLIAIYASNREMHASHAMLHRCPLLHAFVNCEWYIVHIMSCIKPRHPRAMLTWHVSACTYMRYMPPIHECMHHTQCCTDAHCCMHL